MTELERLRKLLDERKVWGRDVQFGMHKAGTRLDNEKGDVVITMLDDNGYFSLTVNGVVEASGKA